MLTPREKEPTLDHDHSTGFIRDVICRNCNAMEGKIRNIARRSKNGMTEIDWLENMLNYWKRHQSSQHSGLIHPTHKTPAEKRELRNAKARKKRAALKGK